MKTNLTYGLAIVILALVVSNSAYAFSLGAVSSSDLSGVNSRAVYGISSSQADVSRMGFTSAVTQDELAYLQTYGTSDDMSYVYDGSSGTSSPMLGTPHSPRHRPRNDTFHSKPDDFHNHDDPSNAPEPASVLLFGVGLVGAGIIKRMRKTE